MLFFLLVNLQKNIEICHEITAKIVKDAFHPIKRAFRQKSLKNALG